RGNPQNVPGITIRAHHHVVMQVDAALRKPGASRRVEPEGRIVLARRLGLQLRKTSGEYIREVALTFAKFLASANDDDVSDGAKPVGGDGSKLWQELVTDDDHSPPRIAQDVLVVRGCPERVDRNRDRAYFHRAEEAVGELRSIEQKQDNPLFWADG